jgi:ComF family protein
VIRGLADVLFPPVCVHCGGLVEAGAYRHLCPECASGIDFVGPFHCPICGHPFARETDGPGDCPHCRGLDPAYEASRSAVLFRGPVRSMLIELKYRRGWHVIDDLAGILRRSPSVLECARGSVLVPVPLHPRKLRERGYNQSDLLARALAREAGGGARVEAHLRRIEDTPSQTSLGRRARQANLKNAFALAPGARLNPGLRYVLVDDVFTTGSTINCCARTLRRAGCLKLEVVTFSHG